MKHFQKTHEQNVTTTIAATTRTTITTITTTTTNIQQQPVICICIFGRAHNWMRLCDMKMLQQHVARQKKKKEKGIWRYFCYRIVNYHFINFEKFFSNNFRKLLQCKIFSKRFENKFRKKILLKFDWIFFLFYLKTFLSS